VIAANIADKVTFAAAWAARIAAALATGAAIGYLALSLTQPTPAARVAAKGPMLNHTTINLAEVRSK
jgi:hypothetical protein